MLEPQKSCSRLVAAYICTIQLISNLYWEIQSNHKKGPKIDPKTINKVIQQPSKKMIRKNIEKYNQKYATLSDCGFHFGASCLIVTSSAIFCLRPVVRNPLDRFWHPLRHHWSDVLDLLVNCSSEYVPKLKDSTPTTPSTNQARIQTSFTNYQSKQIIVYFFCLT